MASSYKATDTQLVAIYRLEFYKKKKKWKLYEDVKKELPPSSKTNKLNKTYNVGEEFPELDVEQDSAHNKAFLHEELDDDPEPQSPDAEPAPNNLYRPYSWPEQPWSEDKAWREDKVWGEDKAWSEDKVEALWSDAQQEWCGAEAEGTPEELACDQCDGLFNQHDLWTPAPECQLGPAVDPLDLQLQDPTPAQILLTTEEWLQGHGYPVQQEDYASTYDDIEALDESAQFVRGAHGVPHSSEIELSITQDCPCTCSDTLSGLTVRQLARALQRHHAALALLLREQALRDALSTRLHSQHLVPFEEYPTRDTDPLRPPDCLLSGSHVAPDTGRGRGRLQQSRRIIGIGMGRPYRL